MNESLVRHFRAIKALVEQGTYFFDYGNSFMKAVYDAGVREIAKEEDDKNGFIFPSYVEDIMGPELLITVTDLSAGYVSVVNMKI